MTGPNTTQLLINFRRNIAQGIDRAILRKGVTYDQLDKLLKEVTAYLRLTYGPTFGISPHDKLPSDPFPLAPRLPTDEGQEGDTLPPPS